MKIIVIIFLELAYITSLCQTNFKIEPAQIPSCFTAERPLKHKISDFSGIDTSYCTGVINDSINEQIKVISEYKNGYKVRAKGFYNNNQLYFDFSFIDNKREGVFRLFYKNRNKLGICCYENNKHIIPFISYYENGSIKDITEYDENEKTKHSLEFYQNGKIREEITAIDSGENACFTRLYYDNGILSREDERGLINSKIICYYKNSQKELAGHAHKGFDFLPTGHWQEWYETGVLKREYYFHETIPNQKEGTWKWFDEQGNLTREEYYKNGEKTGEKEYVPKKRINEK